jgi:hypothetical protein
MGARLDRKSKEHMVETSGEGSVGRTHICRILGLADPIQYNHDTSSDHKQENTKKRVATTNSENSTTQEHGRKTKEYLGVIQRTQQTRNMVGKKEK